MNPLLLRRVQPRAWPCDWNRGSRPSLAERLTEGRDPPTLIPSLVGLPENLRSLIENQHGRAGDVHEVHYRFSPWSVSETRR